MQNKHSFLIVLTEGRPRPSRYLKKLQTPPVKSLSPPQFWTSPALPAHIRQNFLMARPGDIVLTALDSTAETQLMFSKEGFFIFLFLQFGVSFNGQPAACSSPTRGEAKTP